ncbi:MAG: hypothetical protein V9G12_14335 [Microthrixaceae bacterium]
MVAVGRRDERQIGELGERAAELVERGGGRRRAVGRCVSGSEEAVGRPRRADDLERRQPESLRLVFDEHPPESGPSRQ